MIPTERIHKILKDYKKPKIATILSHSSLQIFHGARLEDFKTIGIGMKENFEIYRAFPEATPDELIAVDNYEQLLDEEVQDELVRKHAIIIPHGSFVEYVGAANIEEKFYVPMFGNRAVLAWEHDKKIKQRHWLEKKAGIRMPREFQPQEIDRKVIVKLEGAKGGRGFFICSSPKEFRTKAKARKLKEGSFTIQEFIEGNRYYPSYFYSPLSKTKAGVPAGKGKVELICVDRRDELSGGYTVVGNIELVYRESLLKQVFEDGRRTVDASLDLFPPGMIGPFCLETILAEREVNDKKVTQIYTFEISARIVAGTNVAPDGSRYSCFSYKEPMSMGRRIAREIKQAANEKKLPLIVA